MGEVTLYKDSAEGSTIISNCFIDHYLADANDAQIKVYLYLIRMMNSGNATGISEIADKFNHTEKDVCRALRYWEQKGLLSLDYDKEGVLSGIRILTPKSVTKETSSTEENSFTPFVTLMPEGISQNAEKKVQEFTKPDISLDDLKAFKKRDDTAQILFIAEQYLKRPLSANDIRSIFFITDTLHFSDDLIDYLLQYCVSREKRDFRYIEKVAINWAQEDITTSQQASEYTGKYEKNVYTVMSALGKSSSPTKKEVDYIKRWNNEYGFENDVILEACERTVMATDKHRFEYADKILYSWKQSGVHHKQDIVKADEKYHEGKAVSPAKAKNTPSSSFHQFKQNDYDFEALEQKLLKRK